MFLCCIAVLLAPNGAEAQPIPGAPGEVFRQEGIASWYGTQFDGRPTASGEIFDSTKLTAAHPTLPFGTMLRVTNRNNNRQVSVRVNDRGPFVGGRIIDVSHAAAEYLGMVTSGTAPVLIETMPGQAQPRTPAQSAAAPAQIQSAAPPASGAQAPVHVGSTTIPLDNQQNPITINIFHSPDPSQPPTVIVSQSPDQMPAPNPPSEVAPQVAPQPQPRIQPAPPQPQPQFQPQPQPMIQPAPPQPQSQQSWQQQPQPQPQRNNEASQLEAQAAAMLQAAPPAATRQPPQTQQPQPENRGLPVLETNPNYTYRVQVGSFRVARNAVDTFVRLREANFEPAYERHEDFFRVVLTRIPGAEIQPVIDRLIALGFRETSVTVE